MLRSLHWSASVCIVVCMCILRLGVASQMDLLQKPSKPLNLHQECGGWYHDLEMLPGYSGAIEFLCISFPLHIFCFIFLYKSLHQSWVDLSMPPIIHQPSEVLGFQSTNRVIYGAGTALQKLAIGCIVGYFGSSIFGPLQGLQFDFDKRTAWLS